MKRRGYVVYVMRVSEALSFSAYWNDIRFYGKRPLRTGSLKQTCGDNIYFPLKKTKRWGQLDSFHSNADGTPNQRHIARDTGVNRVLVADEYYYFGGSGPKIPKNFRLKTDICHSGRGRSVIRDSKLISEFVAWCRSLGASGYLGEPWDWRKYNV